MFDLLSAKWDLLSDRRRRHGGRNRGSENVWIGVRDWSRDVLIGGG